MALHAPDKRDLQHFLVAFASTLIPLLFALHGHVDLKVVEPLVAGAAVVAFRQVFPGVLPAK